jgi:hypothetical protein
MKSKAKIYEPEIGEGYRDEFLANYANVKTIRHPSGMNTFRHEDGSYRAKSVKFGWLAFRIGKGLKFTDLIEG